MEHTVESLEKFMGHPPRKKRVVVDKRLATALIRHGYSSKEIAERLGCSKTPIERLKRRIISQALDNQNTQSL